MQYQIIGILFVNPVSIDCKLLCVLNSSVVGCLVNVFLDQCSSCYLIWLQHDSLVCIVKDYSQDGQGLIPGRERFFSLLHSFQISSKAHPVPYPVGFRGSFPRAVQLGCEADHSLHMSRS